MIVINWLEVNKQWKHVTIDLFYDSFSSSGEQPEQRILACEPKQPSVNCIAIFHKYCCYIKHGEYYYKIDSIKSLGNCYWYVKYQNVGTWSMD